jgi:hypothetical protein
MQVFAAASSSTIEEFASASSALAFAPASGSTREEFATASSSRRVCNLRQAQREKSLQPRQAQRVFATYGYEYEVKRIGARTPEKIEMMSFSPLSEKLNENNYRTWAAEMCGYRNARQLWWLVTGEETEPVMPVVPGTTTRSESTTKDPAETRDTKAEAGARKKMPTAKEDNRTARNRRLECYECGEEGHKRAQCPKLEKKMKENIAGLVQEYDDFLL